MNNPVGWFYSMKELWSIEMISILEILKSRDHSKLVKTSHFSSSVIQAPCLSGRVAQPHSVPSSPAQLGDKSRVVHQTSAWGTDAGKYLLPRYNNVWWKLFWCSTAHCSLHNIGITKLDFATLHAPHCALLSWSQPAVLTVAMKSWMWNGQTVLLGNTRSSRLANFDNKACLSHINTGQNWLTSSRGRRAAQLLVFEQFL